jgi:hypothetical protein
MNNVLNMNRLWLLIRRQAVENYKFYLLGVVVIMGLLLVIYGSLYRQGLRNDSEFQDILFLFSLCLGGSVFTNLLVRELHTKTTSIWYLMLPSSALERIILVLFYSILVFIPIHLLAFYTIDIPFVSLFNSRFSKLPPAQFLNLADKQKYAFFYTIFLLIQATTLVGSLYFRQYSYVKTATAIFGVFILIMVLDDFTADVLMAQDVHKILLFTRMGIREEIDRPLTLINLPTAMQSIIRFFYTYLLAPFLWTVAWVRLKETQV